MDLYFIIEAGPSFVSVKNKRLKSATKVWVDIRGNSKGNLFLWSAVQFPVRRNDIYGRR